MDSTVMTTLSAPPDSRDRTVAIWLFVMCGMVVIMVILGGLTRLTHSGLSMVDWRPVTGWLPPINAAEWAAVFDLYKQTPQFLKLNADITVDGFKSIFWLEYIHRLWGRIIGVAFFLPFLFFAVKGWVGKVLGIKLAVMFILGGAQGVLGWYMVQSGLIDRPDVSQYRLTAHFALAVVILGYMFWVAMDLWKEGRVRAHYSTPAGLRGLTTFTVAWIFLTMMSGAFVAGLDAGLTYNTFPLMDGKFVPDGLFSETPWWINLFENVTTVQFDHRILAEASFVLVIAVWAVARQAELPPPARLAVHAFATMAVVQVALGISTLLLVVPISLAALHQLGALALLMTGLWTLFEMQAQR